MKILQFALLHKISLAVLTGLIILLIFLAPRANNEWSAWKAWEKDRITTIAYSKLQKEKAAILKKSADSLGFVIKSRDSVLTVKTENIAILNTQNKILRKQVFDSATGKSLLPDTCNKVITYAHGLEKQIDSTNSALQTSIFDNKDFKLQVTKLTVADSISTIRADSLQNVLEDIPPVPSPCKYLGIIPCFNRRQSTILGFVAGSVITFKIMR